MRSHIGSFLRIGLLLHIHAAQLHLRYTKRRMGYSLIQRFLRTVIHTAHLRAHTGAEHIVTAFQHPGTGTEILTEDHLSVLAGLCGLRRKEGVVFLHKNTRVCQAELVDGLLYIAHHKQISPETGQGVINRILNLVGILIFIYHHFPESGSNILCRTGIACARFAQQKIQHPMFQIAKIQNAAAAFGAVVAFIETTHQGRQSSDSIGSSVQIRQHLLRRVGKGPGLLFHPLFAGITHRLDPLFERLICCVFSKHHPAEIDLLAAAQFIPSATLTQQFQLLHSASQQNRDLFKTGNYCGLGSAGLHGCDLQLQPGKEIFHQCFAVYALSGILQIPHTDLLLAISKPLLRI